MKIRMLKAILALSDTMHIYRYTIYCRRPNQGHSKGLLSLFAF